MGIGAELLRAAPQIITAVGGVVTGQEVHSPSAAAQATVSASGTNQSEKAHGLQENEKKLANFFKESHGKASYADFNDFVGSDPAMKQAYASLKSKGLIGTDGSIGLAYWKKDPRPGEWANSIVTQEPMKRFSQSEVDQAYRV